jgi:hypothetical protein
MSARASPSGKTSIPHEMNPCWMIKRLRCAGFCCNGFLTRQALLLSTRPRMDLFPQMWLPGPIHIFSGLCSIGPGRPTAEGCPSFAEEFRNSTSPVVWIPGPRISSKYGGPALNRGSPGFGGLFSCSSTKLGRESTPGSRASEGRRRGDTQGASFSYPSSPGGLAQSIAPESSAACRTVQAGNSLGLHRRS